MNQNQMQTFEDTVVAVAEDEAQNNDEADVWQQKVLVKIEACAL